MDKKYVYHLKICLSIAYYLFIISGMSDSL